MDSVLAPETVQIRRNIETIMRNDRVAPLPHDSAGNERQPRRIEYPTENQRNHQPPMDPPE